MTLPLLGLLLLLSVPGSPTASDAVGPWGEGVQVDWASLHALSLSAPSGLPLLTRSAQGRKELEIAGRVLSPGIPCERSIPTGETDLAEILTCTVKVGQTFLFEVQAEVTPPTELIDLIAQLGGFGGPIVGSPGVLPNASCSSGGQALPSCGISEEGKVSLTFRFTPDEGQVTAPGNPIVVEFTASSPPLKVGIRLRLTVVRGEEPPPPGALQAELSVDKGCGANYRIGEPLVISFRVSRDALVTLRLRMPDGSVRVLVNQQVRGGVTHTLRGTVGEPPGTRILLLEARAGDERAEAECEFNGVREGGTVVIVPQIRTDRGCLEEGQNPIYFVGDPITVFFRVDGVSQALVRLLDVLPDGRIRLILQQVIPGHRELSLRGTIEPPLGRETLVLQVLSAQGSVTAEDRCSFTVMRRQTRIIGFKFEDLNGDGQWQRDLEPGIEGWEIILTGPEGETRTKTDRNGRFEFTVRTPGTYTVSEETRPGFRNTTPKSVRLPPLRILPGETVQEVLFGNQRFSKISGFKFHDLDADGLWDPGEPGVKGWEIALIGLHPERTRQTTRTDENGYFEFIITKPGRYLVFEEERTGWRATTPPPRQPVVIDVQLIPGETFAQIIFGNVKETCTITVQGKVDDGTRHQYPISKSKVWLFEIGEEKLPLKPLSEGGQKPIAKTSTNHTNERRFDGNEFGEKEEAQYQFQLTMPRENCPPRVVIVSLLWYDEKDLMAVSSENRIGGRFVPIYLAKCVVPKPRTEADKHCEEWDGGPEAYTKTVNFSYGRDPKTEDSAKVIGEPGSRASEAWERNGARPVDDGFMRDSAHFYFYGYKAMRYLQKVASDISVTLKPVVITTFTAQRTAATAASDGFDNGGDIRFGRIAGSQEIDADSRIWIDAGDSDRDTRDGDGGARPYNGNKPDNSIWHELGHYWWNQIYGGSRVLADGDVTHGGYLNSSTTDSLSEGFAEFTSLLVAEHYGDPRPFMYRLYDNNENLEVNKRIWGPAEPAITTPEGKHILLSRLAMDEELAIAGLLWDLHDPGGGQEPTPQGQVGGSDLGTTEDWLTLTDTKIFELFKKNRPKTLKEVLDALHGIFGGRNSDRDPITDIGELFIMHGAFDDVKEPPLVHQYGEQIGLSGHGRPARLWGYIGNRRWAWQTRPARPGRQDVPIIPHANLRLHLVDANGQELDVASATMHIDMHFDPPFSYYDYQDERPLGRLAFFVMPSTFYQATAFLTVEVPGVGRSEPLAITNEEYWNLFESAFEAGSDYLLEHTFIVGPGVTMERVVWDPNANDGKGGWVPAPEGAIEIKKDEIIEVSFRVTALNVAGGAGTDRVVFDRDKANPILASSAPRPVKVSALPDIVKFSVSVKPGAPEAPPGGRNVEFTFTAQRFNDKDEPVGDPAKVTVTFRYVR